MSHKDKEIRELTQKLKEQAAVMDKKDKLLKETEREKDSLTLKIEAMTEHMKSNSVEFDG